MEKVTITVNKNYLGQVLESARVRADDLDGMTVDGGTEVDRKTAAFIRKAVAHIETALDNAQ